MLRKILFFSAIVFPFYLFAQSGTIETGVQTGLKAAGQVSPGGLSSLFSPNYYDGTGAITIPIFDYAINGLNLGLSLNYDTHGIRVDQEASSVGLGWELFSGGSVTREVKELEDEVTINSTNWNQGTAPDGDKVSGGPVYAGIWYGDRLRGSQGFNRRDMQYDLFTANFAGRTVSFELKVGLSGDLQVMKTDNSNISIELLIGNAETIPVGIPINDPWPIPMFDRLDKDPTKNLIGFKIKDEKGNRFYFSYGDYDTKVVNPVCTYYPCTKWNLNHVVTYDNQLISYEYDAINVDYPMAKFEQVREVGTQFYSAPTTIPVGVDVLEKKVINFKGKRTFLTKVTYPNGTILTLQYKDQCADLNIRPLESIKVSNQYDNSFINSKTYTFNYGFFQSPWKTFTDPFLSYKTCSQLYDYYVGQSNADKKEQITLGLRLKLNKIEVVGNDNSTNEPYYSFDYNINSLPRRLDPGKDYYGYANGNVPTATRADLAGLSVILHTAMGSIGETYGVDKTPDFFHAKACILERVTNGMGGWLNIQYKEHELTNPAGSYRGNELVINPPTDASFPTYEQENANDGLCVDEIQSSDGYSADNYTTQKYVYSGGQRFFKGGFSWTEWGSALPYPQTREGRLYTNNCITPMQFINGSNHGYSTCEVKTYNASNQLMGSTKYEFTNLMFGSRPYSSLEMNPSTRYNHYPISNFYSYRMGKLRAVSQYDNNGVLTGSTNYSYYDDLPYGTLASHKSFINYATDNTDVASYNSFWTCLYRKTATYSTIVTNSGNYNTEEHYKYNWKNEISEISQNDEDNNKVTKYLHYDYENPNLGHSLSFPTYTETYKTVNGVDYLLARDETNWDFNTYTSHNTLIGSSRSVIDEPTTVSPPPMVEIKKYTKWDAVGNILEIKHEGKEIYSASVWDTRIGKPIAEVSNAKFDDIAYTSFEGPFAAFGTADDNKGNWDFQQSNVYVAPSAGSQPMTGRYYYPLTSSNTIVSKNNTSSAKAYIVSFWATGTPNVGSASNPTYANGLLKINQQVGNWKFYTTTFTGDGNPLTISNQAGTISIDELRMHPANASMVTTTYEPLFGENSVCDDRGNITYFEYDAMGWKAVVRDINRNVLSSTKQVISGPDNQ